MLQREPAKGESMMAGIKSTNVIAKGRLPRIAMCAPGAKFVLGMAIGSGLSILICALLAYAGNSIADWIASGEAEMTAEERIYLSAIQLVFRNGWLVVSFDLASALAHDVYKGATRYPLSSIERVFELIPRAIFLAAVIASEAVYLLLARMSYEGDQIVGCILFIVMGVILAVELASIVSNLRPTLKGHPFTEALVLLGLGLVSLASLLLFLFAAALAMGFVVLILLISVTMSAARSAM